MTSAWRSHPIPELPTSQLILRKREINFYCVLPLLFLLHAGKLPPHQHRRLCSLRTSRYSGLTLTLVGAFVDSPGSGSPPIPVVWAMHPDPETHSTSSPLVVSLGRGQVPGWLSLPAGATPGPGGAPLQWPQETRQWGGGLSQLLFTLHTPKCLTRVRASPPRAQLRGHRARGAWAGPPPPFPPGGADSQQKILQIDGGFLYPHSKEDFREL